ncbi:WYL domain-containing protein [Stenotrophomonas sp.]|uniref:helix-turn-helix transcriptional regulator n=1 Tax=Stenotrophomonas sp. TaxID=69392 RepID=UPI0028AE63BF|nr:WYL domain-containing protein [Stenotrophomonas sp.]
MLRLIPRHPASISTVQLRDALLQEDPEFDISLRSLQRDLDGLLNSRFNFNLQCSRDDPDESVSKQRPFRWSYAAHARPGLPLMTSAEALAMRLSEGHLQHLLPPGVLALLEPHFSEAKVILENRRSKTHERWAERVRSMPNGKALLPARVNKIIWEQIAEALLDQKQLQVKYLSKEKGELRSLILHPKGIVSRGPSTYLIASAGSYTEPRHFALHRFKSAEALDIPSRDDDFDMEAYLPTAAFTPRRGHETVELIADIHPDLAWILRETPLCETQTITPQANVEWLRLQVKVPDDEETLRWLLGLGQDIRLIAPPMYVDALLETSMRVIALYENPKIIDQNNRK